jgi:hypothetical protein
MHSSFVLHRRLVLQTHIQPNSTESDCTWIFGLHIASEGQSGLIYVAKSTRSSQTSTFCPVRSVNKATLFGDNANPKAISS